MVLQILEGQSFQYATFAEAKNEVIIPGTPNIEYCYDRLSLCVYSHNLDKESYRYIGRQLGNAFEDKHNREEIKSREEYAILFHFILQCPEYSTYRIEKNIRPDFCLGNNAVGIEVTRFVTSSQKVIDSIYKENYDQGKSAFELEKSAIRHHGSKAKNYEYHDLSCGPTIIRESLYDPKDPNIRYSKEISKRLCQKGKKFVDKIEEKYNKYKDEMSRFDEFIILCNAQDLFEVTDKCDLDVIIEKTRAKVPEISGFTLCILRHDGKGTAVDRYRF